MRKIALFLLLPLFILAKDLSGLSKFQSEIVSTINELNNSIQKELLENGLNFVKSGKIIKGSCWDYINGIYNKSNVLRNKRESIFKSKKSGPYAKKELIKSGDWLYHINHSYHNIEHSGMFIKWVDFNKTKALMLSYAGENKKSPARFRVYNIDSVYNIIRAKGVDMSSEYIPLKEYATKNKISIFNVMKLAKNNKIDSITKVVDGKEQIFIKSDAKVEFSKPKREPTIKDLIKEIESLKARVKALEEQLEKK